MAVPISATNSTRRSLSQHAADRGYISPRKYSDSFFSSLFSTRRHPKKSNAISGAGDAVTRYNSAHDLNAGKKCVEYPKIIRKNAVLPPPTGCETAAKPPPGNRAARFSTHAQISFDERPSQMDNKLETRRYSSELKKGSQEVKKTSFSVPSSPITGRKPISLSNDEDQLNINTSDSNPQNQIELWDKQQGVTVSKPRSDFKKSQRKAPHDELRERKSGSISEFIKRSLSRSRSKQKESPDTKSEEIDAKAPQIPLQLTFAQRIKLHKGLRTGNIPVELLSQKILLQREQQLRRQQKAATKLRDEFVHRQQINENDKIFSADAIYNIDATTYLTEALFAIADSQPMVARSTPKRDLTHPSAYAIKGASNNTEHNRNKRKAEERYRRNCIYEPEFYERMLDDSLQVCEQLQSHLTGCIIGVRARSPTALSSPFNSPPTTPILTRSQSAQAQYLSNAYGIKATLNVPPPIHSTSTPSPSLSTKRVLRDASNEYADANANANDSNDDYAVRKYSYYVGLGDHTKLPPAPPIRSNLSCKIPETEGVLPPRVQINGSSTPTASMASRFPIVQRQNSVCENENKPSSYDSYSISSPQTLHRRPVANLSHAYNDYASSTPPLASNVAVACLPPVPTPSYQNYEQRRINQQLSSFKVP